MSTLRLPEGSSEQAGVSQEDRHEKRRILVASYFHNGITHVTDIRMLGSDEVAAPRSFVVVEPELLLHPRRDRIVAVPPPLCPFADEITDCLQAATFTREGQQRSCPPGQLCRHSLSSGLVKIIYTIA